MHVTVKIPEERVGALVGVKRRELLRVEKATRTNIRVDENEVTIEGEAVNVWAARDIVRAVGRGFSPVRALKLLKGAILEVVDLSDLSESRLRAVRSRVIGVKGRTREIVEELTGTHISVYGKTIAIIGAEEGVNIAHEAIEMLIKGFRHARVYAYLEAPEDRHRAHTKKV